MNKRMRFFAVAVLLIMAAAMHVSEAKTVKVSSPNGELALSIETDGLISYQLQRMGEVVIEQKRLSMTLSDRILGANAKVKNVKQTKERSVIRPVVPMKQSEVLNYYNGAVVNYGVFSLEFRVFDNGMAYRFVTNLPDEIEVVTESFNLSVVKPMIAHLQHPWWGFQNSCEDAYEHKNITQWNENEAMSNLPVLFSDEENDLQIFVSETDLIDYPGMFLRGKGTTSVMSLFAPYVLEQQDEGDRGMKVLKRGDFIARTKGTRTFPWRYMVVTDTKGLLESTMGVCLAQQPVDDMSWVRPGQVSWDWWNHKMIWGDDVNFSGGVNTATYKYYIDFASKYGIPYIILDEGWAKTTKHVYETIPEIDLPELISYGKDKGVGLILWLPWLAVENNMDLFAKYEEWGIAGCKIDFMDRQDQYMVNFYERAIKEAAKHHILVDFHGAYKPSGLEQKYPNLLAYEGVRGLEQNGNCHPDNSIYLPFIRNIAGAMDFTPGSMISNQTDKGVGDTWQEPASYGTRVYQMALYTVFETGTQMLADSPTRYMREHECTEFITKVPVTWDETRALSAKVGEYVIIARRKGDKWYVAGITNSQVREREFEVVLDFLPTGKQMKMTSFVDGYNAQTIAEDYRKEEKTVDANTVLKIRMVRNGGFAAVIE